jgi:hypothetical protein
MIDYHLSPISHHAHQTERPALAEVVSLSPRWSSVARNTPPSQPRPYSSKLDPFKPEIVHAERCPSWAALSSNADESVLTAAMRPSAWCVPVRPRRQAAFLTLALPPASVPR